MTARSKAAVLRLDPVLDREEYNTLLQLTQTFTTATSRPCCPPCWNPRTSGNEH